MTDSLTFAGLQRVRLVGVSRRAPFCSIISESKLIYASGNSIILENTKTNQQKILYTHTLHGHIHLIVHHVTLYNEHLLAIAVRDAASLMNVIVVVALNSAIFNLELRKEPQQLYYLRHVEEYEQIKGIHFFQEGSLLGIVSSYGSISSFSMMRSSNGDVLFHQSYPHTTIFMGSAALSKQGYVAVVLQEVRDGVRLCLISTDQLSRRLYYSLQLPNDEQIMACSFQSLQEDCFFLLALTSKGDLLIYKVNDFVATLITRIDLKVKNQVDLNLANEQPAGIQSAGNKVIVYYVQSKTMTLIQFSNFNPSNYKMVILRQTLQQYHNIRAVHSLRIAKDTCTVAGLFRLNSKTLSALPQNLPTTKTINLSYAPTQCKDCISGIQMSSSYQSNDQFIALQMDILQNVIDYNDKKCNVEQTLSLFGGHAGVRKAEYCPHSNSLLLLLNNKVVKYYDLSPQPKGKNKKQHRVSKLQLWASELVQQPTTIAAHPFNFSLVLIYHDIIKFHQYNCKNLFPPHIVASIKPTNFATYSPLGDKLLLAQHSTLTLIDSYTYQTLRTISLNNQPVASMSSSITKQSVSKIINSIHFSSFEEVLVLMGQNSLSLVSGWERTSAFGSFQGDSQNIRQVAFDKVNNLALVVQQQVIQVFAKSSINSTKCTLVSKLQLSASSVLVAAQVGVLFIGADDGSLLMVRWPHYEQQDLYYLRGDNRIYLFDEPISTLHITPSMRYLYAISQNGSIAICQLQVAESQHVPAIYKEQLLKMSDIPLKLMDFWLMSRTDQQRKQRELIKLRGEQVDRSGQNINLTRQQTSGYDDELELKKKECQQQYCDQIRQYQQDLGLQKVLHQISLIKDEIRVVKKQRERDVANFKYNTDEELNKHFQERSRLEQQLQTTTLNAITQRQQLRTQFQNEITFLKQDFQTQNAIIQQKIQESQAAQSSTFKKVKLEGGNNEQDRQEQIQATRLSFEDQKGQLLDTGQAIISKNRNANIAIHNLQNKMGQLGLEKEKIEFDLYKVEMEGQQMKNAIQSLAHTLHQNNQVYNRLMQKTRKQETQLHCQRKLASKNEYTLHQLVQQMQVLEKHQTYLDDLYASVSSEFVEIKEQQQTTNRTLEALTQHLLQLRNSKSKKNYEGGLAKSKWLQACKTLGRELELCEEETIGKLKAELEDRQSEIEQNKLGREFQSLQADKQKMSLDANKWNQIKESYRAGFRKNYRKLNDQNLKLTYQYNDLLKVSQDYSTYINYLTNAISNNITPKDTPHKPSRNTSYKPAKDGLYKLPQFTTKHRPKPSPSFTGQHKAEAIKPRGIVKKSVCISLHQQSGKFITQA